MGQNLSAGPGDYTVENPLLTTAGTPRESEHATPPSSTSVTQIADTEQPWFVGWRSSDEHEIYTFESEQLARDTFMSLVQDPLWRDTQIIIGPIVGYKLAKAR